MNGICSWWTVLILSLIHILKRCIESFIFGVNIPSRWGTQAPFSNITLDWTVPNDLANLPAIVGGKEQDFTYGDCKEEMDMINRAFIETMIEGDAQGRGFQYPIPTYSITKDFDWSDTENNLSLIHICIQGGDRSQSEPLCPGYPDEEIQGASGKY